ncbi:MAG: hypothetical protein U9N61_02250 [Euryarchaeota archaeon]|nr:hypothetical protein [Euryarchaeota archaeon]
MTNKMTENVLVNGIDENETFVVGACNGSNERAKMLIRVAEIVDAHDVKCVHTDRTSQEVLKDMLLCPILREFADAQKAKRKRQRK